MDASGNIESAEKTNEELFENSTTKKIEKNNVKVRKRRRCPRDKTAPRPPHSGYIRYLNDRRDQFRTENPNLPFSEITKVLAAEWTQLPADKKQQYLLAAEQARVKYVEELSAYRKTDAYKNFLQRKAKKNKIKTITVENQELEKEKEKPSNDNSNSIYIPIFSEEFLFFNKARESELRYLRKSVIDQEQEVSVLDKHIENMNNGIMKLKANTKELEAEHIKYEQHLNKLRPKLFDIFSKITLPGNIEPPTIETIDNFMVHLATLIKSADTDPLLLEAIKKAVCNLNVLDI